MNVIIAGLTALLTVLQTSAGQTSGTDDWDFAADASLALSIASVDYAGGRSIRVQCLAGGLDAAVVGLSTPDGPTAELAQHWPDGSSEATSWTRSADGTLISESAARFARSLRRGGRLVLGPTAEGRASRGIDFPLPDASGHLDRVLSDCGLPLVSPLDSAPDVEDMIQRFPDVPIPEVALNRQDAIRVEVDCLVVNSRLAGCVSERQIPADPVAGQATAREAEGKRVRVKDGADAEGGRVRIIVNGVRIRR